MAARKVEDEYELKEELGKGSFSVVLRAINKVTKEEVAIKVIQKSVVAVDEKTRKRLATEVEILRKVNHPNIIPLKDIIDTSDKLYLVMELVSGGELFDKIVEKGFYSEKEAASVVKKVISAIQYLHSIHIAHRDLKPENLLLKKGDDTHVMISDFGLSRILGEDSLMSTACGTPYYVAPEILKANPYTKDVDMWSIGVITYFLLAGFPPFMGDNLPEIVEQIVNADYSFPSPYWDEVSKEAKDFVKKLLVLEPEKRLTAEQALNHAWLLSNNLNEKPLNSDKQKLANHKQLRKLNSFAHQ
jgi:calcium/calmodulin-dependent protein kinase I